MTREEIITAYKDCETAIDKLSNERDIHTAQAQQCTDEIRKWARRRTAWRDIHLNLFDEVMPSLVSEETIPINGNLMTVEDVIKIKEES
jgi:hypothetical protein